MLRISRAKTRPKNPNERRTDLANLRAIRDASSWNELAIGPKIAKLASRDSECNECHDVIDMRRHYTTPFRDFHWQGHPYREPTTTWIGDLWAFKGSDPIHIMPASPSNVRAFG